MLAFINNLESVQTVHCDSTMIILEVVFVANALDHM